MMKKKFLILLLMIGVMLQGCSQKEDKSTTDSSDEVVAKVKEDNKVTEITSTPTPIPEPTSTPAPTPTPNPNLVLPQVINDSGKVLIQTVSKSTTYPYNSYIITSSNGENIVLDPTSMPAINIIDIKPVFIGVTHYHDDHYQKKFVDSYDCDKIIGNKGEVQTKDFHCYSIASSHGDDTISDPPTNIIIVLEVDGLRIAHMGDIGQTALTDEQLNELGEIDIAFMQFENAYSSMSLVNEKAVNLMAQLNPKIIIPTHYGSASIPVFEQKYGEIVKIKNMLEITKDLLPETTTVYQISNEHIYQ